MPTSLSLLDRLLDDFPEERNPRDPDVAADERRRRTWENWRDGLCRDLGMLISTRAPNAAANSGASLPRVAESVARYGVAPARSGHGIPDAPEAVRAAVAAFEPRFRDVRLLPGSAAEASQEPPVVCALGGWAEWDGRRKDLLLKVFSEGDGWKVELYE